MYSKASETSSPTSFTNKDKNIFYLLLTEFSNASTVRTKIWKYLVSKCYNLFWKILFHWMRSWYFCWLLSRKQYRSWNKYKRNKMKIINRGRFRLFSILYPWSIYLGHLKAVRIGFRHFSRYWRARISMLWWWKG